MKNILAIILFFFTGVSAQNDSTATDSTTLRTIKNEAFKEGEVLKYRVHYGIISAGEAVLEVKSDNQYFASRPTWHIVGTGKTVGMFNWFFEVNDRYETYIDRQAMVPWMFIRRIDEGGYTIKEDIVFDPFKKTASCEAIRNYRDPVKGTFTVPDNIQDMVSASFYARTLDFTNATVGQIYPITAFIDNEIVPMNIKFIGREIISTRKGDFRCLKFRPLLQEGRIFKEKEDMTVWVSDDKNKIPIRAQTDILIGSIKMDLVDFSGLANEPAIEK
ncbi:MAG TPA: DUF3108 domain-containing protein [Bacteroidia bacterium]|nr:DUF3108 domain-containing protein [Bacteroidia bacterium]